MSIITLTTDYGLKDHFVGALKGRILSQYSDVSIVDISHDVDPFNVSEASYIIGCVYDSFPKGTVHLIGINIELNHENRPIVVEWNGHFFVTADNGILSILVQKTIPQTIIEIHKSTNDLREYSDIDLFIKAAIHISKGGLLKDIGKKIKSLKEVTELQAVIAADLNSIKGCVVYIDRFGNAVTNITKKMFFDFLRGRSYEVNFKSKKIKSIFAKYSDVESIEKKPLSAVSGDAVAIFNEAGFLEIGLYKSNPKVATAASLLGISYRDAITININLS